METSFYITGGTVPLTAASYLERAADRELLSARQMGKSSLAARVMARLSEEGVSVRRGG